MPDGRTPNFIVDHCVRHDLAPLCLLEDGERTALLAANGDELVLILSAAHGLEPPPVRIDRVTVHVEEDLPVRLDHEEAVARWASPS